jgi:hypothetical protein
MRARRIAVALTTLGLALASPSLTLARTHVGGKHAAHHRHKHGSRAQTGPTGPTGVPHGQGQGQGQGPCAQGCA